MRQTGEPLPTSAASNVRTSKPACWLRCRSIFFEQDAFDAFWDGFTEELNLLRREQRTQLASAPREIAGIKRRSQEILKLLLEGFRNEE